MFFGVKPWTASQLADDLNAAGFRSADNVILHSSLKSLGRTEEGPRTIVDAILEVIGPDGNLMVPTFTYSLPGWKGDPFDIEKSKARTGAIPEYIRHHPDAIRSFHPTHSVAVIGPEARTITENHLEATPLGNKSPFNRMLERNAKILMLGTRQDTNSSLHLCEVIANLPYIHVCFSDGANAEVAWYHDKEEQIRFAQITEVPGCSRGFRSIEPQLEKRGIIKKIRIGHADCQILSMSDLIKAAVEILEKEPTLLLCQLNHCGICPKRRAFMGK